MFLFLIFLFITLLTILLFTHEYVYALASSVLLLLVIIHYVRKLYIIHKIQNMPGCEKSQLLNELCKPFGYCYDDNQNVFSTRLDAWQRTFGYGTVYDVMAVHFQMVFDAMPIYFNYDNRTWLIELWKGQYGINTGAEIGVYHADKILSPEDYQNHMFETVTDEELLCMAFVLKKEGKTIAIMQGLHWWLTGFSMGCFSHPKDLSLTACITFPDYDMLHAFVHALRNHPLAPNKIHTNNLTVSFPFDICSSCQSGFFKRCYMHFVQWKNRLFCKLFLFATKPFVSSADRLLYLYYALPLAFRKIFRKQARRKSKEYRKYTKRLSKEHKKHIRQRNHCL